MWVILLGKDNMRCPLTDIVLHSRRKGIRNCMPRQILLVSTCLMFTASTALAAVDTAIYIVQISVTDYIRTSNGLQLSCEILFDSLVNCLVLFLFTMQ